jgi:sRNA-binding carbon storage regulator CsrA
MRCFLRENECLTVGSVQINVLEVRHDSVKLGIHDPHSCPDYREEVLYIRSDDEDTDDDSEFAFEPLQFEDASPFAIPVR